ncbi:MAG: tetratricopeptide repeat protein [Acidobacteria bacterium]|nr:tetratricopeptide repeat protein [Acidobacteriota bacterium]
MTPAARRRALALLALAAGGLVAAAVWWLPGPQGTASSWGPAPLVYVGVEGCADCHEDETRLWRGSHHDLAMQEATESTVLGDFSDAEFTYEGITSRFYRQDGHYFVRTDGPDGSLTDYAIDYVFGFTPLQQYLVPLPGGRYQALGIAWDCRPAREGGQRWFHLYPGEAVDHLDVLHWTKLSQNWNSQCAECHSTNLRKNYHWPEDRFGTTFSEIDVSCEACHGPGSRHVAWAKAAEARGTDPEGDPGLVVRFDERRHRSWRMDMERGIAIPKAAAEFRVENEMCARCHARRGLLTEDYLPGQLLGQTHHPALLEEGLYYADGQMEDEVYNWGSFLQSRMYAAGITCADCHDAHSAKVKISKDDVCSSCHQPERFAVREHHFHDPEKEGGSCVACHMRTETYMVVDPRHDHSLRAPRPDLTLSIGSPNACNDCHRDKSTLWAQRAVERWYPEGQWTQTHYGETLQAGRTLQAGAEEALVALAADAERPGIVRGTAVTLLPGFMGPASRRAITKAAADPDPLVRLGAASTLEAFEPADRLRVGAHLLDDPVRVVRVEAVVPLADVPAESLTQSQRVSFDRALDEFFQAQRANAERPEAHVNLGLMHVKRGRLEAARRAYEAALQVGPWFLPAYANLADLLRLQGRDDEGEKVLRAGLEQSPDSPSLHHALGLLLVRQKRTGEALEELARAAELAPGDPQLAYVYAIGLHSTGETDRALAVLRRAHERSPAVRPLLVALATVNRDRGALGEARKWAAKLLELSPDDPAARGLVAELNQLAR